MTEHETLYVEKRRYDALLKMYLKKKAECEAMERNMVRLVRIILSDAWKQEDDIHVQTGCE